MFFRLVARRFRRHPRSLCNLARRPSICPEPLERRVLMAGSPTDILGDGTFGPPTHNFTIATATSASVVQGSTTIQGTVLNVAANATSATIVVTGSVVFSGGTNPPSSHDNIFNIAVVNVTTGEDLDVTEPDPDNAMFTWTFDVPAGDTPLRYEARKTGVLQ